MSNTNELHAKRSIKKPRSFRKLNTASIVRAAMMEKTFKNKTMNCNLFVLDDIWNNDL